MLKVDLVAAGGELQLTKGCCEVLLAKMGDNAPDVLQGDFGPVAELRYYQQLKQVLEGIEADGVAGADLILNRRDDQPNLLPVAQLAHADPGQVLGTLIRDREHLVRGVQHGGTLPSPSL